MKLRLEKNKPSSGMIFLGEEAIQSIDTVIISPKDLPNECASVQEVIALVQELEVRGAFRYALRSLGRQALHSRMLIEKLKQHHVSSSVIEKTIQRCIELGYVNDEEWVARRIAHLQAAGKSARDIQWRMKGLGINVVVAADDHEVLSRLIEKKYRYLLDPACPDDLRRKAFSSLARKGFSFDIIKKLLHKK